MDVVPADWVAEAIVELHQRAAVRHDIYHLSSGRASPTYHAITEVLASALGRKPPAYVPGLARPVGAGVDLLARWAPGSLRRSARLIQVFWPYLHWDTVFENARVVAEIGKAPAPFVAYCVSLLDFARGHGFEYPYRERARRAAAGGPGSGSAHPAASPAAAGDPGLHGGHAA
jgi:hypothetical protein